MTVQLAVWADPASQPLTINPAGCVLAGGHCGSLVPLQAQCSPLLGRPLSWSRADASHPLSDCWYDTSDLSQVRRREDKQEVRDEFSSGPPFLGFKWPQQLSKFTKAQNSL